MSLSVENVCDTARTSTRHETLQDECLKALTRPRGVLNNRTPTVRINNGSDLFLMFSWRLCPKHVYVC